MSTRHRNFMYASTLSPFPEGWYFVASRKAVLKEKLIQKTWMGENVVVWCDENERISVAEAFCPHLGADLAPAAGGRVCDGRLVCPFHGYEFDTTGQCVATPYADPPRTAKLRVFETHEVLDMIFAWWESRGENRNGGCPRTSLTRPGGAISRSEPSAFPAIHRRLRRTRWTWRTCVTFTGTTT